MSDAEAKAREMGITLLPEQEAMDEMSRRLSSGEDDDERL